MPDLCEIVAKVKKTKENQSETTIFVFNFFNFFNFFNYLGGPLPGWSLGDGLRSEHITAVTLCSSGCLSEAEDDYIIIELVQRTKGIKWIHFDWINEMLEFIAR